MVRIPGNEHQRELEKLRADLAQRNTTALQGVQTGWDLLKGKLTGAHSEKMALYRMTIDIIAPMVADIDLAQKHLQQLKPEDALARVISFEKARLRAYGYLAMFAPQEVMDAHDEVMAYLIGSLEGSTKFE